MAPGPFAGLLEVLIVFRSLIDPLPDHEIATCVKGVKIAHIMRKGGADDCVPVSLQGDGEVAFDGKEVVKEYHVVLAAGEEKSTVGGKLNIGDIGTVTSFVLLNQDQGLETSVEAAALVHRESLLLSNC